MALGRPVVHSHIGGAPEMIRPGENGFLFPVGDTEALVDRLVGSPSAPTANAWEGRRAKRS